MRSKNLFTPPTIQSLCTFIYGGIILLLTICSVFVIGLLIADLFQIDADNTHHPHIKTLLDYGPRAFILTVISSIVILAYATTL